MRWYEWNQLKPGMKVAAPVFGRNRLLLAPGMELDWTTIKRLPTWGIFHVLVHAPEASPGRAA